MDWVVSVRCEAVIAGHDPQSMNPNGLDCGSGLPRTTIRGPQ